jgi:energy-coupling factor transporter ATP-binding protein EcfA2
MIVGVFLRNYKCYSNINFIPLGKPSEKISLFIGANGIGKSSILESLNCALNNIDSKTWETTLGQKKDRTYICPVFLIKKSETEEQKQLEAISEFFWNHDLLSYNNTEPTRVFCDWREELKKEAPPNDYYLVCIGKDQPGNVILTTTFHKKVFDTTKRLGVSKDYINNLFTRLISLYSYIYIPVENRISDILSLQAQEMQGLMDKKVVEEIRQLLSAKDYQEGGIEKKKSIVDLINDKLEEYIDNINNRISEGYKFEARGNYKKTIKPNDILHAILNEYFSIRPLTKDGKNIKSLSSGQQRLALIDVASTLLSTEAEKSKKVILAIDEPESSLEAALRFHQFSRLVDISERLGHQVAITTHWYGLLLRPSRGRLHFVSEAEHAPNLKSFPLKNLYDNRRHFPDSIEMKSYFDLMSSMLSILKNSPTNWLICEGYEDALYLNLYLKHDLPDIIILPFNGCGNVKKLFEFLSVPFSDDDEVAQIKGRIFCLIDNDEKCPIIINGYKAGNFNKKLSFNRILLDRTKLDASIISVANPTATNTEIEDILDAKIMWAAISSLADEDIELSELIAHYEFDDSFTYSDLTKNAQFLKKNTVPAYENLEKLKEMLHQDEYKRMLAESYCKIASQEKEIRQLPWIQEIIKYFKS